jgi:hypothetical protein
MLAAEHAVAALEARRAHDEPGANIDWVPPESGGPNYPNMQSALPFVCRAAIEALVCG